MKWLPGLLAIMIMVNSAHALQDYPKPFTSSVGSWSNIEISKNGRYIANVTGSVIFDQKENNTINPDVSIGNFMTTHGFSLSEDGNYIAFTPQNASKDIDTESDQDSQFIDVYLRDIKNQETILVSAPNDPELTANGRSLNPQVSRNGQFVVFMSEANNLTDDKNVPSGNATKANLYIYDRNNDKVSHLASDYKGYKSTSSGSFPNISEEGRFVLYDSTSSNTPSTLIDRSTGKSTNIESKTGVTATVTHSELSSDGRYALIQHHYHTANQARLQLFDRKTGKNEIVSVPTDDKNKQIKVPTTPLRTTQFDLSGNGRYIAFSSSSNGISEDSDNNLKDVFVYDRNEHEVKRINVNKNNERLNPSNVSVSISEDGHYVTFNNYVVKNPLFDAGYCESFQSF